MSGDRRDATPASGPRGEAAAREAIAAFIRRYEAEIRLSPGRGGAIVRHQTAFLNVRGIQGFARLSLTVEIEGQAPIVEQKALDLAWSAAEGWIVRERDSSSSKTPRLSTGSGGAVSGNTPASGDRRSSGERPPEDKTTPSTPAERRAAADSRDDEDRTRPAPRRDEAPQKELFAGRYEMREKLGQGGFGVVHKAWDTKVERFVAIKTVNVADIPAEDLTTYLDLFHKETRIGGLVAGMTGILSVLDGAATGDKPFIAMELAERGTLKNHLERHGPMSWQEVVRLGVEVAEALHRVHQEGIVHRDIKPSNIFIGNDDHYKVGDFGIARKRRPGGATTSVTTKGAFTVGYAAPEQIATPSRVDRRADLFALGVVLYEALTGRLPYSRFQLNYDPEESERKSQEAREEVEEHFARNFKPIRERRPDIPAQIARVIERALSQDPNQRFRDCHDFAETLKEAERQIREHPARQKAAPDVSPHPDVDEDEVAGGRRWWIVLLLLAAVVAAGAVGLLTTSTGEQLRHSLFGGGGEATPPEPPRPTDPPRPTAPVPTTAAVPAVIPPSETATRTATSKTGAGLVTASPAIAATATSTPTPVAPTATRTSTITLTPTAPRTSTPTLSPSPTHAATAARTATAAPTPPSPTTTRTNPPTAASTSTKAPTRTPPPTNTEGPPTSTKAPTRTPAPTNTAGPTRTHTPKNDPPRIEGGMRFDPNPPKIGAPLTIEATVTDPDGDRVECSFFVDGVKLLSAGPCAGRLSSAEPGDHPARLEATDGRHPITKGFTLKISGSRQPVQPDVPPQPAGGTSTRVQSKEELANAWVKNYCAGLRKGYIDHGRTTMEVSCSLPEVAGDLPKLTVRFHRTDRDTSAPLGSSSIFDDDVTAELLCDPDCKRLPK